MDRQSIVDDHRWTDDQDTGIAPTEEQEHVSCLSNPLVQMHTKTIMRGLPESDPPLLANSQKSANPATIPTENTARSVGMRTTLRVSLREVDRSQQVWAKHQLMLQDIMKLRDRIDALGTGARRAAKVPRTSTNWRLMNSNKRSLILYYRRSSPCNKLFRT